ncbi:MAG TPA: amidohydrolase family protein [Sphingomonadaceae bacterium]|nr:amidohydrolase family protein [Sphingomonadaceae bacterium]
MEIDRRSLLGASAALLSTAAAGAEAAGKRTKPIKAKGRIRRIATEEAFATHEQIEALRAVTHSNWANADVGFWRGILSRPNDARPPALLDIGEGRLRDMDANGVDMQLLSLTSPGVQMFDADTAAGIATSSNDELAAAIARHPTRFAGLAAIAPQDPARAVKELDRAIGTLKLNGIIINSHTNGEYLDQERYWPILEAAEALNAAIYIHPRTLPESAIGPYLDYNLWSAMWGYAAEAGLHGMRILTSGVLDRFPKLKIVLGHMGEGIPYWVYRIDHMYGVTSRHSAVKLKMKPSEYLTRNFAITTSGMNHHPALDYCVEVLGADNIMWAIDYPYQDSKEAVTFMDSAALSDAQRAKIYHGNAETLFHIAPA